MTLIDLFRAGLLTLALAGLVAAQTAPVPAAEAGGRQDQVQRQATQVDPSMCAADPEDRLANPGCPAEVPNRELSGDTPATNSTLRTAGQDGAAARKWETGRISP